MFNYFIASIFIILVHYKLAIGVYYIFTPIDSLDAPSFFFLMQTLSLPILAIISINRLIQFCRYYPDVKSIKTFGRRTEQETNARTVSVVQIELKAIPKRAVEVALTIGIIVLLMISTYSSFFTLGDSLHRDQGFAPYAPTYYSQIQNWYVANPDLPAASVLVLPYSYATYNRIEGFLPSAKLWLVRYNANAISEGYNVNKLASVMSLLYEGHLDSFAYALNLCGVKQVIVVDNAPVTALLPTYTGLADMSLKTSKLLMMLNSSISFKANPLSPELFTYEVLSNFNAKSNSPGAIEFGSLSSSYNQTYINLVSNPSFTDLTDWGSYLSTSVVALSNKSAEIQVRNGSNPHYTILWTNILIVPLISNVSKSGIDSTLPGGSFYVSHYAVFVNASVVGDIHLSISVYWYNSTQPTSFYGQIRTAAVADVGAGTYRVASNMSAPAGAVFARLVFEAYGPNSTNGSAYISSPDFAYVVSPRSLNEDTSVQVKAYRSLSSSNHIPRNQLLLAWPFNNYPIMKTSIPLTYIMLDPTVAWDPQQAPTFVVKPTALESLNRNFNIDSFLIGGYIANNGSVSIYNDSSKIAILSANISGSFLVIANMSTVPSSVTINVVTNSSLSLSYLGFVLVSKLTDTKSPNGLLLTQLPIGFLYASFERGQGYHYSIHYSVGTIEATSAIHLTDLLPITGIALAVVLTRRKKSK